MPLVQCNTSVGYHSTISATSLSVHPSHPRKEPNAKLVALIVEAAFAAPTIIAYITRDPNEPGKPDPCKSSPVRTSQANPRQPLRAYRLPKRVRS